MKRTKWLGLAMASTLALPLTLQGCAQTAVQKRVDTEVAQENTVNTRSELRAEADQTIKTAPGLTDEQRTRLLALRTATSAQSDELRLQSLKLRSVLIKDLITTNYDQDEVALIKKRMRDVEDQRLSLVFKAVEDANVILGHDYANRENIMDVYFEGHGSRD